MTEHELMDFGTTDQNTAVGIFATHNAAEDAVQEIQRSGLDMKQISIVGRDQHTDEHVVGYYNIGDRMMYWGTGGAVWGGLWGLLFGAGFFWVPVLGPMLVAGPLVAMILGALQTAVVVGGLSVLGAALYGMGIPKDSVIEYEVALKTGQYVLVFHGTTDEVERARDILARTKSLRTDVHHVQQPVHA